MSFTLIGCTEDEKQETTKPTVKDSQSETKNENHGKKTEGVFLKEVGLKLSSIEPTEKYYRISFDESDTVIFYMETTTEKQVGEYIHKVYNACKKVADDRKIYDANFNFYLNDRSATELKLPSKEQIDTDGKYNYITQFGYLYNGQPICVTIGSLNDIDSERNGNYYPVYTVTIS